MRLKDLCSNCRTELEGRRAKRESAMQRNKNEGPDGRRAWCLDLLAESLKQLDAGNNAMAVGWLKKFAKGLDYQRLGSWRDKLQEVLGPQSK
jgi:hypothetical protein